MERGKTARRRLTNLATIVSTNTKLKRTKYTQQHSRSTNRVDESTSDATTKKSGKETKKEWGTKRLN
jgi:hypothetical protein